MFNKRITFTPEKYVDSAIKVLISAALMSIVAPINFEPSQGIPLTLQSLMVLLPTIIFGWRIGALSVVVYLILGGIGMPVFANYTSGWQKFTGLYAGYLFGFLAASIVVGALAESLNLRTSLKALLLLVVGHVVILALGLLWQNGIAPIEGSLNALFERLAPGLLLKVALGVLFMVLFERVLLRFEERKG